MFQKGNPGRPKGALGGRGKALKALDEVLAEEGSIRLFKKTFRESIEKNPLGFWKKIVEPLLPKHAMLDFIGSVEVSNPEHTAATERMNALLEKLVASGNGKSVSHILSTLRAGGDGKEAGPLPPALLR